ncbi:hypothetical protein [Amycolatopsis sp. NPDC049159]|uniref:hypothetical protein n=1 Tax=Amycolatopsis sp. NPDC049159 TaxID=3157210 RepID=UPI003401C4FC
MNAQEHVRAADAWLARAEQAWTDFDQDGEPRDISKLRKAEVATGLSRAHAALASLLDRPRPSTMEHRTPNGLSIPVSPVPPRRGT